MKGSPLHFPIRIHASSKWLKVSKFVKLNVSQYLNNKMVQWLENVKINLIINKVQESALTRFLHGIRKQVIPMKQFKIP